MFPWKKFGIALGITILLCAIVYYTWPLLADLFPREDQYGRWISESGYRFVSSAYAVIAIIIFYFGIYSINLLFIGRTNTTPFWKNPSTVLAITFTLCASVYYSLFWLLRFLPSLDTQVFPIISNILIVVAAVLLMLGAYTAYLCVKIPNQKTTPSLRKHLTITAIITIFFSAALSYSSVQLGRTVLYSTNGYLMLATLSLSVLAYIVYLCFVTPKQKGSTLWKKIGIISITSVSVILAIVFVLYGIGNPLLIEREYSGWDVANFHISLPAITAFFSLGTYLLHRFISIAPWKNKRLWKKVATAFTIVLFVLVSYSAIEYVSGIVYGKMGHIKLERSDEYSSDYYPYPI